MFFAVLQPFLLPHFEARVSLTGCGEAAFLLSYFPDSSTGHSRNCGGCVSLTLYTSPERTPCEKNP